MSVNLTIAGQSYTFPTVGDDNWGENVTDWATAVSTELLQRTGGTFTLTNDVNFGASFATIQAYLKSRTANISTAEFIRLARTDAIAWRNQANSANLLLAVNSSNQLTFDGVPIPTSPGGILPVANGGTGIASYTVGDILYATGSTTLAKLGIGTANFVLSSTGSAPAWGLLVNANIDAAAAITRSKLATGTTNAVVINNGSGVLSDEAQLDETRGGTGIGTYTTGDVLYASASNTLSKLAAGTTGQVLTMGASVPAWATPSTLSIQSKTANYTALVTDGVILCDASGGAFTITLYSPTNAGVLTVTKTDSDYAEPVTVSLGGFSTTLNTEGESVQLAADGSAWNIVQRTIPSTWTSYTPAVTGDDGTPTIVYADWLRNGPNVTVRAKVAIQTPNASTLAIGLPTGLQYTLVSNAIQQILQGTMGTSAGGSTPVYAIASGPNAVNFAAWSTIATAIASNVLLTAGTYVEFQVTGQIDGWNG